MYLHAKASEFYCFPQTPNNIIKGQKDRLDIAGLIFYSTIDYVRLKSVLDSYGKTSYIDLLVKAIGTIERRLLPYLNLNELSYAKIRRRTLEAIAVVS